MVSPLWGAITSGPSLLLFNNHPIPHNEVFSVCWWFSTIYLCSEWPEKCCGFLLALPGGCEYLEGGGNRFQVNLLWWSWLWVYRISAFGSLSFFYSGEVALSQTDPVLNLGHSPRLMIPTKRASGIMIEGPLHLWSFVVCHLCPFLDCETLCSVTHALVISWITAMCFTRGYPWRVFRSCSLFTVQ